MTKDQAMTTIQERLRFGASIARDRRINLDYAVIADEAAGKIDALEAEVKRERFGHDQMVIYYDALEAQMVAAEKEIEHYRTCADAMAHKIERDALMAKVDALTKDAQRYQCLATSGKQIRYRSKSRKTWYAVINPLTNYEYDYEASLDAAVDAAIAEGKV